MEKSISQLEAMAICDLSDMDRKHDAHIAALAESISREGLREPVTLAEYSGKTYMVEGHHRLLAVKRLGWTEMPAHRKEQ
ncbi:MAG TPA: ParB N-terminal domain-containing protein [Gemmatimonadales bacterium]|nr:ParB N-terminal domain-containing protein [Gemmatimonadales bacterium]